MQHVWRKHADQHGGNSADTFRAESHKKLVEPFVREAASVRRGHGHGGSRAPHQGHTLFRSVVSGTHGAPPTPSYSAPHGNYQYYAEPSPVSQHLAGSWRSSQSEPSFYRQLSADHAVLDGQYASPSLRLPPQQGRFDNEDAYFYAHRPVDRYSAPTQADRSFAQEYAIPTPRASNPSLNAWPQSPRSAPMIPSSRHSLSVFEDEAHARNRHSFERDHFHGGQHRRPSDTGAQFWPSQSADAMRADTGVAVEDYAQATRARSLQEPWSRSSLDSRSARSPLWRPFDSDRAG
jgi:hypothetical protein